MNHSLISPRNLLLTLLLFFGVTCHAEIPVIGAISSTELSQRLHQSGPPLILDVRTPNEYLSGHIQGAVNISHDQLERRIDEIPGDKSREIVVYCQSGRRAGIAEKILVEKGYTNIKSLTGHWQNWSTRSNH
ncbi:MAG: rhodanese-like domain-containing protein [Nitrosomonadaceae bacterium]